jgi:hypothetical protein
MKSLDGKKVYIPEGIIYPLPATEKAFSGNFPLGTSISVDKDLIFGVHWENLKSKNPDSESLRIDLDLSTIDVSGSKLGWDSSYRQRGDSSMLLFSGDLTNAPKPKGATELIYVAGDFGDANYIVMLNYFNAHQDTVVPFKIIIGKEKVDSLPENYMINPNNVISIINSEISSESKNKIIGLVKITEDKKTFLFNESSMGTTRTSSDKPHIQHARDFLFNSSETMVTLNGVVKRIGVLIDNPEDADIDLSPENLEKDTILNLMKQ